MLMIRKLFYKIYIPAIILSGILFITCYKETGNSNQINKELLEAAKNGDVREAELLLEKGADINYKNDDFFNKTPIIYAAVNGYIEMVDLFLSRGIDINKRSDKDWTLLMYTACQGSPDMIEILITRGANVNIMDSEGWTALMHAEKKKNIVGYDNIIEILENYNIQ